MPNQPLDSWVYLLGVFLSGGGVIALFNFLIHRHKNSGEAEVTDAQTLWKAGEKFRKDLLDELHRSERDCYRKIKRLERDLVASRVTTHSLRNELLILTFALHPDTPEEIKETMLKRQSTHILSLTQELEELEKEVSGFIAEEVKDAEGASGSTV